jgi:hypothetical protein
MATINWPSNTAEITDAIRDTIGRDITIYITISGIPCPASGCSLNPVTNLSTNQFCSTCDGNYWINTTSGYVVNAHVTHKEVDTPVWEVGGRIVDGDALVQFKYTQANMDAVNNADYYIVDGRKFNMESLNLRGVPQVNRILVALVEEEGE